MKKGLPILALTCGAVFASTYGGAYGTNKLGEHVSIEGELAEFLYVRKNDPSAEPDEIYQFEQECPSFRDAYQNDNQFSCRIGSQSPLAGATYKITTLADYQPCKDAEPNYYDDPGEVYICIKGCESKRVPAILYVAPSECV